MHVLLFLAHTFALIKSIPRSSARLSMLFKASIVTFWHLKQALILMLDATLALSLARKAFIYFLRLSSKLLLTELSQLISLFLT